MLRHCVFSVPLTRCHLRSSYMTLAHSAGSRPSVHRPGLPTAGRMVLTPLLQSLPWRCASHRLFVEKRFVPALSRLVSSSSCQPVPWLHTSQRQKNTYYGFASRNPPRPSRYAKFYFTFIGLGFFSIVLTPL